MAWGLDSDLSKEDDEDDRSGGRRRCPSDCAIIRVVTDEEKAKNPNIAPICHAGDLCREGQAAQPRVIPPPAIMRDDDIINFVRVTSLPTLLWLIMFPASFCWFSSTCCCRLATSKDRTSFFVI